jgi:hypothetical protein
MQKYRIGKAIIHESRYAFDPYPHLWPGNKVKIIGSSDDVEVYKTKGGWLLRNNTKRITVGKKQIGMGWEGFATSLLVIKHYLAMIDKEIK